MSITLGTITFDDAHTSAVETYAEVGGRDARKIALSGLVLDQSTIAGIEARLDAILEAASDEDYGAALSLRTGRQMWVRRAAFERQIRSDQLAGSYTLTLEARDPFEYAVAPSSHSWNISASGAVMALASAGSADALPVITLQAQGSIVNPAFSDGARVMAYSGALAAGRTLTFDAPTGRVTLDGADVTPYTTGLFPLIDPDGTTLHYTDDAASSHLASVTVTFHDRWW